MLKSGWVNKPLGEVCTLQRGFDLPKHSRTDGEFPLISSSGEIDRIVDFKVNAPGVATGRSGSIGNVFFIEENYWPLNTVLYVKDFHGNDERFVYYLLKRFDLNKYATGAGVPTLNRNHVHDEIVAIPESKEEQTRIVAILDEAFANTSQAVANAEKNLANARELFDSYLNEVFTRKGEGWIDKKIEHACDNLDSKRIPITKSDRKSGDTPYYGASGIVDYVNDYIFEDNLLLVSEDGANLLARTYPIAFSISGKAWVNNHAHVLKFSDIDNQKITEYYLNSISLEPYVSGMAQPKLNQKALNGICIPFPPKNCINAVVKGIEDLSSNIEELEDVYRRKLAALAELKQALLQKAFTGELTA
ncbi:restriction endonuclease subunit S [Thiothrix lacustris]|uniref:restriction endonuclease subunit S n=1 Tax=Thiothrix lacustris TaxID=525917 RepID=UPI000B15859D|nr:restriction endonuclease subunit S [Thiothrix lacustris]